ncbi:hypothetical protein [Butyrivibrio fibrisolvens]|uniref:hypothetical protein n=1 Tax=Butyrivibrio fibrisolvens TaxID=831 RepID=UPI000408D982|nr:hypothetical protein [Butyrivibrio fibrisolvens]
MVFQNAFFEEEVREGFTVSSMMKRAWAAELEVLDVVKKVCAEHDIKWYAFLVRSWVRSGIKDIFPGMMT